jgi:hypothetical protein
VGVADLDLAGRAEGKGGVGEVSARELLKERAAVRAHDAEYGIG